jgi:hypothetical protein
MGESLIQKLVKLFDIFGRPILLIRRNRDGYKTACGGCASLAVFILVVLGAVTIILDMYHTQESSTTRVVDRRNLESEISWDYKLKETSYNVLDRTTYQTQLRNPSHYGFNFALKFGSPPLNSSVYSYFTRITSNRTQYTTSFRLWTLGDFPSSLSDELTALNISSYYWINDTSNMNLRGYRQNDDGGFFGTFIMKWSSEWATLEDQDTYVKANVAEYIYTHSKYNYEDSLHNPIKYVIEGPRLIYVASESFYGISFGIKFNQLFTIDGQTKTIVEVHRVQEELSLISAFYYFAIAFWGMDEYTAIFQYYEFQPSYNRNLATNTIEETNEEKEKSILYTILYVASQMGGFYVILITLFGLFIFPIGRKIFLHESVNDLNEVEERILKQIQSHSKNSQHHTSKSYFGSKDKDNIRVIEQESHFKSEVLPSFKGERPKGIVEQLYNGMHR